MKTLGTKYTWEKLLGTYKRFGIIPFIQPETRRLYLDIKGVGWLNRHSIVASLPPGNQELRQDHFRS